jgi:hypothetical protein
VQRVGRLESLLGLGPWSTQQVLASGWSRQQLQRAVDVGALVRVRRGIVRSPHSTPALSHSTPAPSHSTPVTTHATPTPALSHSTPVTARALLRAVITSLPSSAVISHGSAAAVHGLWQPAPDDGLVHVTVAGKPERLDASVRVHGSRLPESLVSTVDGLRVTSPARTAVDLARGRSLPSALVALDGAVRWRLAGADERGSWRLRDGLVPVPERRAALDELATAYASVWGWPGTRVVRQALDVVDPASESPLESWSRGWILLAALPQPELNVAIVGASGRTYFGDFVWTDRRVVGEADGMAKYGVTAVEQRRRLGEQRRREDDLERAGWRVVRWATGDSGPAVVARLARALALDGRVTA